MDIDAKPILMINNPYDFVNIPPLLILIASILSLSIKAIIQLFISGNPLHKK
ncbi:hypothetical protein A225_0353 [Klebsiella michiganensis E718]|nr:hypothetical protein A225_0353 [Klebsiella michiganensis E718]